MTDGLLPPASPTPSSISERVFGRVRGGRIFFRFLGGSAAGLAIDLGGFSALTAAGVAPLVSNLCSSFASITVVYLLVTRYAFAVGAGVGTYAAFVAWYSTSIVVFSTSIELVCVATGADPLVVKVATVPVSFAANYWFSRRLFARADR